MIKLRELRNIKWQCNRFFDGALFQSTMMVVKKVPGINKFNGLKESEVKALQQQHGKNVFSLHVTPRFLIILRDIVKEPMFLLLTVACALYFIMGQVNEGILMFAAMVFVSAVSIYQELKSSKAIEALQQYTEPKITVIRDGMEKSIESSDLVPGDLMLLQEGNRVPADALVVRQNDLTLNESVVTGESFPVGKSERDNNQLYQGTTVNSGQCYARVTATGNKTTLGRLGKTVSSYSQPKTLLQMQVKRFVRQLALFGFIAFIIILSINYIRSRDAINSLLFALTLAMAIIPEEIPVAFSSFMALGAFYMAKRGIISRQPQTIENLGAVSVICLDKTGTITQNRMQVKYVYDDASSSTTNLEGNTDHPDNPVLQYAMLASEKTPFDAMEKAIWEAYQKYSEKSAYEQLPIAFEYPLEGQPPVMTHVYEIPGKKIVAAKGGVERILRICGIVGDARAAVMAKVTESAAEGYRVIGVASSVFTGHTLPESQDDFDWKFEGLLSFSDPVKDNISASLRQFDEAGIAVKLLTGDYAETAMNVARQVGIKHNSAFISGDEIMQFTEEELKEKVRDHTIFARMFPDAKLRVVEALRANGDIVAMTGDGVNDAPALKASNIGIAMGYKGTEMARQAADLVLTNDDVGGIAEAIEQGRKIFSNLKKAIRYIVSIHIPIIFTASLPVLLGWHYPNIFSPIHIIFLELIMGPTCSIFFEKEPVEKNIMLRKPRPQNKMLFAKNEIWLSIIQGLVITIGVLLLYYYFMERHSLSVTRTVVFTTLILSNIFLTFANRSFTDNIIKTIRYKNPLALPVILISLSFLALIYYVPFIQQQFLLTSIPSDDFYLCLIIAAVSVLWIELYKALVKITP